MPLPDASLLSSLPHEEYRALGKRLAAVGLTGEAAAAISSVGARLLDPMRRPARLWRLRRDKSVVGLALRMFVFDDPVTEDEAHAVLGGEVRLDHLVACGLITRRAARAWEGGAPEGEAGDRYASPFLFSVANGMYVMSDDLAHGGDAVMGGGATTSDLARASFPRERLGSLLDVGCGAGTLALVCSPQVDRAIGVDINPRAIEVCRVNAAINGVTNVEFRVGDLFAPVAGETFELIVSQPPFVPKPAALGEAVYLYGGARGDELAMRFLAELPRYLSEKGRASCFIEWPLFEGEDEPLVARVRRALSGTSSESGGESGGDALDLLLLENPGSDLDEGAVWYAATAHPQLGEPYARAIWARRDHLEAMKIRDLKMTYLTIARAHGRAGWTTGMTLSREAFDAVTSGRIDSLFAARALAVATEDELLAARLRLPASALMTNSTADGKQVRLSFEDDDVLLSPVLLSQATARLFQLVHGAPSTRAALKASAAELKMPVDRAIRTLLPALREALAAGVLERA